MDEYMPRPGETSDDTIDIGLPDDQIMQRYLVRRIFKESEFLIKDEDGEETVGFITGIDDRCIQLSTTPRHPAEDPISVLIFWPVKKIAETGRKLNDLDHEYRSKIRTYSHALRAQCERFMTGKVQTARREARKLETRTPEPEA